MTKNAYPELPEMKYKRTAVEMPFVVAFAKTLQIKYPLSSIRMAYAIFRNESANGSRGVNNNYGGVQADLVRWTNLPGEPIGTCVKVDSGNVTRRFLCFDENGYKTCFELMCIKATDRSMVNASDYFKKWVGNPKPTATEYGNFESLLRSAKRAFPDLT